ncbi:hypothetical protein CXG81DRAFT_24246 [Caulochytrium protostelioides]|uniref:Uncharacterized protein n=1 Tax=Caulochytrium protostelioides TaxID=1555241 RepID=A0A4P9XCH5_9FUNG|nr:hypothetical protein CXG81DRAFT_24246 [Caulochytrium protostelioides]|eukprot:RKP03138.1 hypothetical protein CXG81DRAFT_24246 [Caulochytrium protostelioides]
MRLHISWQGQHFDVQLPDAYATLAQLMDACSRSTGVPITAMKLLRSGGNAPMLSNPSTASPARATAASPLPGAHANAQTGSRTGSHRGGGGPSRRSPAAPSSPAPERSRFVQDMWQSATSWLSTTAAELGVGSGPRPSSAGAGPAANPVPTGDGSWTIMRDPGRPLADYDVGDGCRIMMIGSVQPAPAPPAAPARAAAASTAVVPPEPTNPLIRINQILARVQREYEPKVRAFVAWSQTPGASTADAAMMGTQRHTNEMLERTLEQLDAVAVPAGGGGRDAMAGAGAGASAEASDGADAVGSTAARIKRKEAVQFTQSLLSRLDAARGRAVAATEAAQQAQQANASAHPRSGNRRG